MGTPNIQSLGPNRAKEQVGPPTCSEINKRIHQQTNSAIQDLQIQSFCQYYSELLPTNKELLDPSFNIKSINRLKYFFFINGRDKTLEKAQNLGFSVRTKTLGEEDVLTKIFSESGIDLEGLKLQWIESKEEYNGGLSKHASEYGGQNERIIIVENYDPKRLEQNPSIKHAKEVGFSPDLKKAWLGRLNNELFHALQKHFGNLFTLDEQEKISPVLSSFDSKIPNLKFKNNAQASEFLSDVMSWNTGAYYFRFFNALDYMHPDSWFYGGEEDRYNYTYQVQKYAMIQILTKKGYQNAHTIVENIQLDANNASYPDFKIHYRSAKKYFDETDFDEIAKIYRTIGISLLKTLKPHFQKNTIKF